MCTRVCETVSRDEDGGDKACGSYRACWEGIPHLTHLSLLAWGWILKWHIPTGQSTCSSSTTIKVCVKSFDKPCQFPTDMTAILGGNTHCLFWVPCESLLHLLKGDTKKVEGKHVL